MSISAERAQQLYRSRPFAAGHPAIEARSLEAKTLSRRASLSGPPDEIDDVLGCLSRAVALPESPREAAVIGCGPFPDTVGRLTELGWTCRGIEPVEEFVTSACVFLGRDDTVFRGSAENLPLDSDSQLLVIMQSVLEHVDSPLKALDEAYRVLVPGGALYVSTTNRLELKNHEYTVRFFQWLPALLKEAYVHQHLHFEPSLARYSSRPAVNWFAYADLCQLGRAAGFYRFYSKLDLLDANDAAIRRSKTRQILLNRVRFNPWLRSIALTQKGGSIFMLKRPE